MRSLLLVVPTLFGGVLRAAASGPAEVVPERMPDARPRNVVFILFDDHRHDAMGLLARLFAKTSEMDSMTGGSDTPQPGWNRWMSFAGQAPFVVDESLNADAI